MRKKRAWEKSPRISGLEILRSLGEEVTRVEGHGLEQ